VTLSGKILILSIILLMFLPSASAYNPVSSVSYSGNLQDSYMSGINDDIVQIYYQKFTTNNITLSAYNITLYLPSNVTGIDFGSTVWDAYLRIGIAKSSSGTLTYTPLQWYNLGDLKLGFQCYADEWKYRNKGTYVNFILDNGNGWLEPNTVYYLAWYIWSDVGIPSFTARMPGGNTYGVFNLLSIHRGNVTSGVWTNPYAGPGYYSLAYLLSGGTMNVLTTVSLPGNDTSFQNEVIINDGENFGRNWTYGVWLGNVNTDLTVWEQNITLQTDSTTTSTFYAFSGLTPGKFYHIRGWEIKNASYPFVFGNEVHVLTTPEAPTNNYVYSRDSQQTILNWTLGSCFEANQRTVIFSSETGYVTDPTNPGDASIFYNGTGTSYTGLTGTLDLKFTYYTYIQATEDGVTLTKWSQNYATNESTSPPVSYNVVLLNEVTPFGNCTPLAISYQFSNKDGTINFMGGGITNPFGAYCNASDVFTVKYNATGVERSVLITHSLNSSDNNISVYMPNVAVGTTVGTSQAVRISFIDHTGDFTVAKYAAGIIYKKINNQTVMADANYVQADVSLRTYLISGDTYSFAAKSDYLSEMALGDITILPNQDYYVIDVSPQINSNDWRNYITVTTSWLGNTTSEKSLYLSLDDSSQGLYNMSLSLYSPSGLIETIYPSPAYHFDFTYPTGSVNKSSYWVVLNMKYHNSYGYATGTTTYFWNTDKSGIEVDMDTLDLYLTETIGPSPVYVPTSGGGEITVPYSILIVSAISIVFFFLFPPEYAAFTVILMGFILAITRIMGLVSSAIMSDAAIGVIFLLGALLYLVFKEVSIGRERIDTIERKTWEKIGQYDTKRRKKR